MKDAKLITTKAFPAAGADNSHDGIDIGPINDPGHIVPDGVEIEIVWPALANLVDTKTITFTVQDSADNSSFATIEIVKVITGAGGVGVAAGSETYRLPANTRRYVRVNQAVLAAGGDNTASSSTVSIIIH